VLENFGELLRRLPWRFVESLHLRVGPSVHAEAGVFSELAKRLAGLARAARIRPFRMPRLGLEGEFPEAFAACPERWRHVAVAA
jgi:hypothetical protein